MVEGLPESSSPLIEDSMSDQTDKMLIGDLITAVASRERERCAKLCEDYAAECSKGSSVSSMAEDKWCAIAGRDLAEKIRELK